MDVALSPTLLIERIKTNVVDNFQSSLQGKLIFDEEELEGIKVNTKY